MAVETGSTIENLVATNPLINDKVRDGTQHFWLIKKVLKTIFPGASGQGFSKPITATEDELNRVKGVTSPIQTQINALANSITASDKAQAALLEKFQQATWPVGSIFINALVATNPEQILGFGKWQRWSQGKVLVSADESNPILQPKATGGSPNTVLVRHQHTVEGDTQSGGLHSHRTKYAGTKTGSGYPGFDGGGDAIGKGDTDDDGTHNHHIFMQTTYSPGHQEDGVNKNYQPFVCVYMWLRVA